MVRISVSETYDLSTKVNKMSLIGIHTPNMEIVKKAYGGVLSQSKLIRFHHADVRLACAQVLPADPLQVGVEAGDIAPQDMFNPVLYKAVSNQAMNEFELRMHGLRGGTDPSLFQGKSIDKTDNVTGYEDEFKIYYSLLANRKGFKVAHPQRGLHMASLRPYVYERFYSQGDAETSNLNASNTALGLKRNSNGEVVRDSVAVTSLRGRPRPMPPVPVATLLPNNVTEDTSPAYDVGVLDQTPGNKDMNIYCGLIIMPPAKLNVFYYRLVVRWYIDLIGVRPYNDIETFATMNGQATTYYGSDYFPISSSKDAQMGMVDMDGGNIEKIMEGA